MVVPTLSDSEVLEQIPAAKQRARNQDARAVAVRYQPNAEVLRISLANGATLAIPIALIPSLRDVPRADIAQVRLGVAGISLRWDSLDEDLSIAGLAGLVFGKRTLLSAAGSAGGSVRSSVKSRAAKINGRKGGRPRKRA